MSKFTYDIFYGGLDTLAVSKERYTKEEAIEIAKEELELELERDGYLAIGNGYARHRAGLDEDHEPCVGWWLEYEEHERSCPCWVFHTAESEDEWCSGDYEYIDLEVEE